MNVQGPNLFIVGAPKCGTTALYSYLNTHPNVFFPPKAKEPHFYNTDMPGFRWYDDKSEYLSLFADQAAQNAVLRGEASVQYLYSNAAAAAISEDVPNARILICLRDPVPFIRSYHNQMLMNLDEDIEDLREAWNLSGQSRTVAREASMLDYKAMGKFAEQIDRYRAVFHDDQIRIFKLEDFAAQPKETYAALLKWLDLPDDGRTDFEKIHGAKTPRSRGLARMIKSPPPWLRSGASGVKRMLGLKSLGVAKKVKQMNAVKSYGTAKIDADLAGEIEMHFAEDQKALARHADLFLNASIGDNAPTTLPEQNK